MSFFLYLLVAALCYAFFWVKKRFSYWSDRGFASPKPSFPFGSMKGVGTKVNLAIAMDKIYKRYKGNSVVGIFSFLSPQIMPLHPELIKDILVRDFSSFHDRGFYYNKEDDPLSAK